MSLEEDIGVAGWGGGGSEEQDRAGGTGSGGEV